MGLPSKNIINDKEWFWGKQKREYARVTYKGRTKLDKECSKFELVTRTASGLHSIGFLLSSSLEIMFADAKKFPQ